MEDSFLKILFYERENSFFLYFCWLGACLLITFPSKTSFWFLEINFKLLLFLGTSYSSKNGCKRFIDNSGRDRRRNSLLILSLFEWINWLLFPLKSSENRRKLRFQITFRSALDTRSEIWWRPLWNSAFIKLCSLSQARFSWGNIFIAAFCV